MQAGGTLQAVARGVPNALLPEQTESPDSDDSGLSGGEIAAIVVVLFIALTVMVIIVVGVLVVMQRRRRQFELLTAGGDVRSGDGTYYTDTFEPSSRGGKSSLQGSGTFPMKPSENTYTAVGATDTAIKNEAAMSEEETEGGMKEDREGEGGREESDKTEKDILGESSKDTHL